MRSRILVLSVLTLTAGCGVGIQYVPLNPSRVPLRPRSPDRVELWSTGRPTRPYADVGMIEARQESQFSQSPPAEIVQKMREAAGQAGCDGLILTGSNDAVVGGSSVTNGQGSGSISTLKGYRGSCIVYTDGAGAQAAPPAAASSLTPASSASSASSAPPACQPPCSPGYACHGVTCQPLCNPQCAPGMTCGPDRVCR